MGSSISATRLLESLQDVVDHVRKGARFTATYRGRPVFQLVPIGEGEEPRVPLEDDPLYKAGPVGTSRDGGAAADHDEGLYPN